MKITKEFVEENRGKRFDVEFKDGTIKKNIGFFIAQNGLICRMTSRQRSRGYLLDWNFENNIKSITETVKKEPTVKGNAKKLLNRIHPNVWSNLQEEYKGLLNGDEPTQDFKWHFMDKLNFRNLKSILGKYEVERLEHAFETKSEYRWNRLASGPQGRDLSISTELCKDGIFRAWFSSEYPGCGNGDYYLLLNPTTAVYYERD